MQLLVILALLFVSLWVLIAVGERLFKPLEPGQMARLSRIVMVLMGVLILVQVLRFWLE